jgi:ectoine hydroxylase-related dioxygenase (phytanoyl-CoA dioxygenase family)
VNPDVFYLVIPGFHRIFDDWVTEHENVLNPDKLIEGSLRSHFFEHPEAQALSIRVPCRAGSIIIWDQRCTHGTRPNKSLQPRAAMFLKAFTSKGILPERARARLASLRREFRKAGGGFEDESAITPVGRIVFGMNLER